MRRYCIYLAILFIITNTYSKQILEEKGVLILNDLNFDTALEKYDRLLINFYTTWCEHCKEFNPIYEKSAQILKNDPFPSSLAKLAKVDLTYNEKLGDKYLIEEYPTLKYFEKKAESEDYDGAHLEHEIVEYMRKKMEPPIIILSATSDVISFNQGASDVSIVFFGKDEELYKHFSELALLYDDLHWGICQSDDCLSNFNTSNGDVIIFNKDGKAAELKAKPYSEDELKKFVDENLIDHVSTFNERAATLIFGRHVPALFFYRIKGSEFEKKIDEIVSSVAEELKGKIQIIITDVQEGIEQKLGENFNITVNDLPTVKIHDSKEDDLIQTYNLEGGPKNITTENIIQFVNDWKEGKFTPKILSEDESITIKNKEAVIPIVATNFDKIVRDPKKDVLVLFYHHQCADCTKLMPIYDELAHKVKKSNYNLIIAKINTIKNDMESEDIEGFPTIKLYKKDSKTSPTPYEDAGNLSQLVDFLNKELKDDFVRPGGVPIFIPEFDAVVVDQRAVPDDGNKNEHERDDL